MKLTKIICNFVFLLIGPCGLFAQTGLEPRNFFFVEHEGLYDITTLEEANTKIPLGILFETDNPDVYGIKTNSELQFFDEKWNEIGRINIQRKYVAPDGSCVLTVEENDIWLQEILNFKEFGPKIRITEVGLFNNLTILNWFEDKILIEGNYLINLTTKNISKYEGPEISHLRSNNYNNYPQISPSRRYFVGISSNSSGKFYGATGMKIYDFEKEKSFEFNLNEGWLGKAQNVTWISNDEFLIFTHWESYPRDTEEKYKKLSALGIEIVEGQSFNVTFDYTYVIPFEETPDEIELESGNIDIDGRPKMLSLNKEWCFIPSTRGKSYFLNLESGVVKEFNHKAEGFKFYHSEYWEDGSSKYAWIGNSQIVFSNETDDIFTAGTYVLDVETMETNKISSFSNSEFYRFPESEYVLIRANNKIFRMKIDGTGFVEAKSIPQFSEHHDIGKWLIKKSGRPFLFYVHKID